MAKYGLNQVTLIGNLGRDPELKYTDKGIAVVTLNLACTESYRDSNGQNVDRTTWVSVVLWRGQAEIAGKYCRKGSTVAIEGRINTRTYTTQQNETRYVTEVEGRRIILLDRPQQSAPGQFSQPVAQQQVAPASPQQPASTPEQPASTAPQTPAATPTPKAEEANELDDLPF